MNSSEPTSARLRQAHLGDKYRENPGAAMITDRGRTQNGTRTDPFHGEVVAGSQDYGLVWPFGIHRAVGGFHDGPNPGDLLCAALAACLDSTIRIVADRMGVVLEHLAVDVTANVDVRGTLMLDRNVPAGFQTMRCHVDITPAASVRPEMVGKVVALAERSCVNMQTLRAGLPIELTTTLPEVA
ncbi:MAG TPA: OsmC family protein [Gemmatimonadaceae bacterium]|nr:OsmC family protein [Gemmatimonadaceae bacterium]